MIARAFRELGHDTYEYGNIYESHARLPNAPDDLEDIDLWLYCEMNDGDPQYHEVRNVRARKLACSLYDTSYYPDHCEQLIRYFNFDQIFLANPISINRYKSVGFNNVHYLPYACDLELHGRCAATDKQYDVTLIGSIRQDREELQSVLTKEGIKLDLIGGLYREDYIDALSASTITINQNPAAGRGLLNMRFWEAQAAGSVLFTEEEDILLNRNAGLQDVTCYPYKEISDIVAGCTRVLQDAQLKREVIAAGQERVFRSHTYENRCEEILEMIK
jgi:spore maturation protein CgeB